jgi:hypothetical protein
MRVRVGGLSVFLGSEKVGIRHARVESAAASASRRVPGRHLLVAVLERRLRNQVQNTNTIAHTQTQEKTETEDGDVRA